MSSFYFIFPPSSWLLNSCSSSIIIVHMLPSNLVYIDKETTFCRNFNLHESNLLQNNLDVSNSRSASYQIFIQILFILLVGKFLLMFGIVFYVIGNVIWKFSSWNELGNVINVLVFFFEEDIFYCQCPIIEKLVDYSQYLVVWYKSWI